MQDVIRELERYGKDVESTVTPITIDELRRPSGSASIPAQRPRWSPVWVTAVVAAAMVLVGVGGISFLLGGPEGSGEPVANGPQETVGNPASPDVASGLTADSFTWTRHDLEGHVTYPMPWQGGYVALVDDLVAGSSDGVVWQAWPSQPPIDGRSILRGLAVDADRVVVISDLDANGTYPPTMPALSAWASADGETWHRIGVDDPIAGENPGWTSFLSTDGDHIIVTTESGAWTVDGDRLRVMEPGLRFLTTTGSLHQLVERAWPDDAITMPGGLDTVAFGERGGRFVAFGSPPFGAPHTWTSSDGRVWSDITPVVAPWDADICRSWVASLIGEQDGDATVLLDVLSEECDAPWASGPVIPSVVATGPLGWFAAGTAGPTGAPTFAWYSSDGLGWEAIDSIDGLANDHPDWVSFPPIVLVEANRVLIYASSTAASDAPEALAWSSGSQRQPSLWIGEPNR